MSLFGGAAAQTRSRNLVEFKAGKMNLRGNMVHPDKRKGLVYLYQGNDMLMHFCWKDRSSTAVEDDLVIFPEEIHFKKVTQNTTGRVYILKWRSNARKLFFWMQEPKEDKDEEFCKKINDLLNRPPTPGFGDEGSGAGGANPLQPLMERMTAGGAGGLDSNDITNVLRGMDPNDLASLLSSFGGGGGGAAGLMQGLRRGGGATGATTQQGTTPSLLGTSAQQTADSRPNTAPASTRTTGATATSTSRTGSSSSKPRNEGTSASSSATVPSTTSSGSKGGAIQMSALTSVLANLGNNTTQETSAASSSKPAVDLCDIMSSEHLIPLLSNKDVQEKLRVHLPDGTAIVSTEKELRESVQSPQFRQTVTALSAALQSGELGPALVQFGFPDDVTKAANQGDIQAFAKALEKHYKTSPEDVNEKKSSDNTMDTD